MDPEFAAACVGDNLPAAVDRVGLSVVNAARSVRVGRSDGPPAVIRRDDVPIAWLAHSIGTPQKSGLDFPCRRSALLLVAKEA